MPNATNIPEPTFTTRKASSSISFFAPVDLYIVSGPAGHADLLARTTEAAALRDGRDYFLATRRWDGARWILI